MEDLTLGKYWQTAGDRFGFRAIAPCLLSLDKNEVQMDVLLPDFGGARGMLLVTDYELLRPHLQQIGSAGYGFSVLTNPGSEPNLADVAELLSDWGWSGPGAAPVWLREA